MGNCVASAKDKSVQVGGCVASGSTRDAPLWTSRGDGTPLTGGKVAGGVIWQSSLVEKKQDPQVGNLWWRLGTGTGGGIGQTLAIPTRETSMDAGMG